MAEEIEQTAQIALLIDCENVPLNADQAKWIFDRVGQLGHLVVKRDFGRWDQHLAIKPFFLASGVDMIEMGNSRKGSNRADIRIVVDAMELAITKSHIDTFVLVSGDSDFVPLLMKLREYGRTVIVVARSANCSHYLPVVCDQIVEIPAAKTMVKPAMTSETPQTKTPQKTKKATERSSPVSPLTDRLLDVIYWTISYLEREGIEVLDLQLLQSRMRRLFPTVDLKGQGFGKKRRYCRLLEALSDHGWCRLSEPLTPATSRIRMTKQFFTRDVKMEKPDTFERPRPTGPSERKAAANTNPSSPEVVKPTTQAVARKAHREDEVVTAHVILMPGIYQQHFWE